MRSSLITCFLLLVSFLSKAQYPRCFFYDSESGLPSNEVYSIVQDANGFVWLGCGAGLYKFDGVRYNEYQSKTRKSRSITGLTISSSGVLYCFNFKSQTFYIGADSLRELQNPGLSDIINMTADRKGNIYVSHLDGISCYNEKSKKWTLLFQPDIKSPLDKNHPVCKASRVNVNDELYFVCPEGIGFLYDKGIRMSRNTFFKTISPRKLDLVEYNNKLWIFAKEDNYIYQYSKGELRKTSEKLQSILYNRKITHVKVLSDGKLWICTYKGMVRYDESDGSAELFYPEIAFSDCLVDREGNYWFSTLQAGMLRVPDLRYIVWNKDHSVLASDRLSKIGTDGRNVYFTSANGLLAQLNVFNYELKTYNTGRNADIQSLDYDYADATLWFNHNNDMFGLKNGRLKSRVSDVQAIKARSRIGEDIFLASSHGTFINGEMVNDYWAREVLHESSSWPVWVVTNNGLLRFSRDQKSWVITDTLLAGRQVLSVDRDTAKGDLYALCFDGSVYKITQRGKISGVVRTPAGVLSTKLKYYKNSLYLATNKGLWIWRLNTNSWQYINTLSGLASDNVQDLVIVNNALWLTTGKGLQKIPVQDERQKAAAIIHLKKLIINDKEVDNRTGLQLDYGLTLLLYPEAAIYSCQGNFQYAYRIRNIDTAWVELPGNIEKIEIQNIPAGKFEIELKTIDCFRKDSFNKIVIEGYINPPFWKKWWFNMILLVLLSIVAFLFFRERIRQLKKKQQKEIEQINIENELRLAQQRALRAQMNPHFIFNVLNSIKSYIYRNDREKALVYLDDFSHLVRTVLEMSDVHYTTLGNELKMLKLYIDLEAMMLSDDFSYRIRIENQEELSNLKFPSLILQPYVENAFKHGLRTKQGDKNLSIEVSSASMDSLSIKIADNGIGRHAAAELNKENIFKRASFATNAIQHRIELINKEGLFMVKVDTADIYDSKNNAAGTEITINIVYNN